MVNQVKREKTNFGQKKKKKVTLNKQKHTNRKRACYVTCCN